ncbi:MAG TPA: hypothetical protein VNZ25_06875, partial [Candidatus Angelobacter sp.]|nr:hypothetical protein [Candidatus Angelobacter sp.]
KKKNAAISPNWQNGFFGRDDSFDPFLIIEWLCKIWCLCLFGISHLVSCPRPAMDEAVHERLLQ